MSGVLYQRRGTVSVPNATALDERLSCRALGLLLVMLARPAGASYDMREFAKGEGREGRDALLTAAKELRALGYLHTTKVRLADGQYVTQSVVADEPITDDQAAETWAQNQPQNPENPPDPPDFRAQPPKARSDSQGLDSQTPVSETPVSLTPSLGGSLRSQTSQENQRARIAPTIHATNAPGGSCVRCYVFHPPGPCRDPNTDHETGLANVRTAIRQSSLEARAARPSPREEPAA